jgi:hypothetical protein
MHRDLDEVRSVSVSHGTILIHIDRDCRSFGAGAAIGMAFFAILFEGFTAILASYPDDLISISAVTLPPIAGEAMIVDSALLQNKRHCRCGGQVYEVPGNGIGECLGCGETALKFTETILWD